MAAYGLEERFKTSKDCVRLLDPTAYDLRAHIDLKQNKYPFCSSSERETCSFLKSIDTIYDADIKPHIPGATGLQSKSPRFPYEAFKPEDIEEILCRCGIKDPCQCPIVEEKEEPEVVCQANVRKRLFQGPPPRSAISTGLSVPSIRRDRGFEILPNGATRRLLELPKDTSPPFYEAPTPEFTQFYRGWKWGRWSSQRKSQSGQQGPGPAHYDVKKTLTESEICQENIRSNRRKYSKQPRYLDSLISSQVRQNLPGPAHYSPQIMDTSVQNIGPLAERFPISKHEKRPGPAEYSLKSEFDLPAPTKILPFHSHFPPRAPFTTTAPRLRYRIQKSPGPGDYDANVRWCKILHCSDNAPFLSSEKRWKEDKITDFEDDFEEISYDEENEAKPCQNLSWQFKSKTKRFADLHKQGANSLSPKMVIPKRPRKQVNTPFMSSEKRFEAWFNFVPNNKALLDGIGPAYYDPVKAKCYPAVTSGPLYRARRFGGNLYNTPPPNEYRLETSMDSILATHNLKLKANVIEGRRRLSKCKWKLPVEPRIYSKSEKVLKIINKAIDQLECEGKVTEADKEPVIPLEHIPKSKISLILEDVEKTLTLDILEIAGNVLPSQPCKDTTKDTNRSSEAYYYGNRKKKYREDTEGPKQVTSQDRTDEKTAEAEIAKPHEAVKNVPIKPKDKMLRTFLYKHPQRVYF